jgi:hypothetical protein
MDYVALAHARPKAWAALRELNGHDEQAINGTDTETAVDLVERLLVSSAKETIKPGTVMAMATADRDRLLAAVYRQTYGDRIEGTLKCSACHEPFDLLFSLSTLLATLESQANQGMVSNDDGSLQLSDGRRFRLPTGADEFAVWHLEPAKAERELLRRCVLQGDPELDPEAVQEAMQTVAPVIDLDLAARCPECEHEQKVHFNIQAYLLHALLSEQRVIAQEIHLLALTYRWNLSDILSLPRRQRRAYVALIQSQADNLP